MTVHAIGTPPWAADRQPDESVVANWYLSGSTPDDETSGGSAGTCGIAMIYRARLDPRSAASARSSGDRDAGRTRLKPTPGSDENLPSCGRVFVGFRVTLSVVGSETWRCGPSFADRADATGLRSRSLSREDVHRRFMGWLGHAGQRRLGVGGRLARGWEFRGGQFHASVNIGCGHIGFLRQHKIHGK